ncbi:MAG: hypothetical protein GYB66_14395, partial [Chloroflexi bacterium]|nr:hypothetical protein [Chloroflexota bacterium]
MSDQLLKQAAGALKSGDRSLATQYIKQHLRANPRDVRGWWAIAQLIEDPQRKIQALERVLAIDPGHEKAQRLLSELQPSSASFFDFNADEDDPELSGSLFDDEMPGAKMGAAADLGEPELGSVRSTKAAKPARVAARRRLRISSSDILIGAGAVSYTHL